MRYIETLASYIPSLIVERLIDDEPLPNAPFRQRFKTVCLFCDVSGFTTLSGFLKIFIHFLSYPLYFITFFLLTEAMAQNGKGAEGLARHLNAYFR